MSGTILAQGVRNQGGTIVLDAGDGGNIAVSNATLDASGTNGGGSVAIGGWNQNSVTIDKASLINASATSSGNGGRVTLESKSNTNFAGQIAVSGGPDGGGGGSVDVSSTGAIQFTGFADLHSARGAAGSLTLDPSDLFINADGVAPEAGASAIAASVVESELASGNLTLTTSASGTQSGNITIAAPLQWTQTWQFYTSENPYVENWLSVTGQLTLDAANDIDVKAPISVGGWAGPYAGLNFSSLEFTNHAPFPTYIGSSGESALTFNAAHFINVQSQMTFEGDATLSLNDGGQLGALSFAEGGNANFSASAFLDFSPYLIWHGVGNVPVLPGTCPTTCYASGLYINGNPYFLANSLAEMSTGLSMSFPNSQGGNDALGFYAFANDYNAAADGTYTSTVLEVPAGSFVEGLGHTISNLSMASVQNGANLGLFDGGSVSGATGLFENLNVTNASIVSTGSGGTSGIFGDIMTPTLFNIYVSGTITATGLLTTIGGVAGSVGGGSVLDEVYSAVNIVTGQQAYGAGGLLGTIDYNVTIENSGATGSITCGSGACAGLIGQTYAYTPGYPSIFNSFATGNISGGANSSLGGLVGILGPGSTIVNSHASGSVTGGFGATVGGLVGNSSGAISNSYALGAVTADGSNANGYANGIGGLVGSNSGTIQQSYATGTVSAPSGGSIGGLVGSDTSGGGVTSSYWDISTNSGANEATQAAGNIAEPGVTGETAASLMTASTYSGWTFGALGGSANWVIVDSDGTLNNNGGSSAGGTFPMLLSEYSTNIENAHQLQLMELDPTASYALAANINASGTAGGDVWGPHGFVPIGENADEGFSGIFSGEGYSISNLTINLPSGTAVGLFGASTGTITNVGIIGGSVNGGSDADGASVGTLLGLNFGIGTVSDSYATSSVSGGPGGSVGGLVGYNYGAISNSYATGSVADTQSNPRGNTGGLVGENDGTVANSYATGAVNGGVSVGGLVGYNTSSITSSYATGPVTDMDGYVGGLVGSNTGAISDSYATGSVTGLGASTSSAGGLVGYNYGSGTIGETYATGAVAGGSWVGGLIGFDSNTGDIASSYWNTQTSGVGGLSQGVGNVANDGGVSGETTSALMTASTFSGWTFGGLGSSDNWVLVDNDGTINNAGGSTGATTPMLLSEYSTNIVNAHQLQLIALAPTASYTLANDIDLTATNPTNGGDVWGAFGFVPIGGNNAAAFTGSFNGQGYTINGLYIDQISEIAFTSGGLGYANGYGYVGLFGSVGSGGVVENVGITNAEVTGGAAMAAGALAGWDYGAIKNSYSTGSVTSGNGVEVSENTVDRSAAGGLVGVLDTSGTISNSYSTANVTVGGSGDAGGLVGGAVFGGTIANSYATGTVTAGNDLFAPNFFGPTAGGLVGNLYDYVGLDGSGASVVQDSFATGNVSAGSGTAVGGLVGYATGGAQIISSTASGTATAGTYSTIGGLVGQLDGTNSPSSITNSYAIGSASSTGDYSDVGGLVGELSNGATIARTYSLGSASGPESYLGGLVGDDGNPGGITASYWNTQTSNISNASQGAGNIANDSGITGETTAALMTPSTFAGWQFGGIGSTWVIVDGDGSLNGANGAVGATMPMLVSEYSANIVTAHQLQLMELAPTAIYTLENNIDLSATNPAAGGDVWGPSGFVPIGGNNAASGFTGAFIGQGHTISGLFIDDTTEGADVGFFGYSYGGTIDGVGLENATVEGGVNSAIGGLVGDNRGQVDDSFVASISGGSISGESGAEIGGLVGINDGGHSRPNGEIDASYSTETVSGDGGLESADYVGGLVGESTGIVDKSYATGAVSDSATGEAAVGGLVGYNSDVINASYATGAVTGDGTGVGGLVGVNSFVNDSFATGTVNSTNAAYVGGLAGLSDEIIDSYATGTVNGGDASYAGGLVGNAQEGFVTNSYATGVVNDSANGSDVGGLVGSQNEPIVGSYATGAVNATGANGYVGGLVGYSGADITNSYATGAVAGNSGTSAATGGLVGASGSIIDNSYANGAVTGSFDTGGLVGNNGGTIVSSYATNAVSGFGSVGGLVGYNAGTISNSYAGGAVSGAYDTGGLAGQNDEGTIGDSYATGAVSGSGSNIGGLVGVEFYGAITDSFWDIETSGIGAGNGVGNMPNMTGVAGETTAQLQGVLPGSFSSSSWGTGVGLFPYLLSQYPNGTPQAISGFAFENGGVMPVASTSAGAGIVSAFVNGSNAGSVTTGVNGYYYVLLAPGAISAGGSNVIAYSTANAATGETNGATLQSTTGSLGNFDIWGNTLIAPTTDTTYSTASATSLQSQDASLISQAVGSNSSAQTLVSGLTDYGYIATGSGFTVDTPVNLSNGLYVQATASNSGITVADTLDGGAGAVALATADGNIALDAAVNSETLTLQSTRIVTQSEAFDAANVELLGSGATYALTQNNNIGTLAADSGTISVTDHGVLTIGSVGGTDGVTATGTLTLTTRGSGADFVIDNSISTPGTATLQSAGTLAETGAGAIDALVLGGGSVGGATLNGPNQIGSLATFTNAGPNGFSLTDDATLTVIGAVSGGTGNLTLKTAGTGDNIFIDQVLTSTKTVDLISSGTIGEDGAGYVNAETLTGSSSGGASLSDANQIANLDGFTNVGGGNFALLDDIALTVNGAISAGTGNVTLTTTGTGNGMAIDSTVATGGTVDLDSSAAINESGAGAIAAAALTGSSSGGATLSRANQVTTLDTFANAGTGGLAFTDATTLTVDGELHAGTGNLTLSATGTGSNIVLEKSITTGGTADLQSAGSISQLASGTVTAETLMGSAGLSTTLNKNNQIADMGSFTDTGGNFVLSDDQNLTITGVLKSDANIVTLTDTGTIAESGAGLVDARTFKASSSGGATLSGANAIVDLGTVTNAGAGGFAMTDTKALTIAGTLVAGTGDLSLTTSGVHSNIAIDAAISSGSTIDLKSAGTIKQNAAGIITAQSLTGSAAGGTTLNDTNQIVNLDGFTDTGGNFALSDGQSLTVSGTVNTGKNNLSLQTTAGDLVVDGALDAGTLTLGSTLGQVYGDGAITVHLINVSANTGIDLNGPNQIKKEGTVHTNSGTITIDGVE